MAKTVAKEPTKKTPAKTVKPVSKRPTHLPNGKFAPGNVANPNGRPRVANSLSERIRAYDAAPDPGDPDKRLRAEVILETAYEMIVKDRNPTALRLYWERGYGSVPMEPFVGTDEPEEGSALYIAYLRLKGTDAERKAFVEFLKEHRNGSNGNGSS